MHNSCSTTVQLPEVLETTGLKNGFLSHFFSVSVSLAFYKLFRTAEC